MTPAGTLEYGNATIKWDSKVAKKVCRFDKLCEGRWIAGNPTNGGCHTLYETQKRYFSTQFKPTLFGGFTEPCVCVCLDFLRIPHALPPCGPPRVGCTATLGAPCSFPYRPRSPFLVRPRRSLLRYDIQLREDTRHMSIDAQKRNARNEELKTADRIAMRVRKRLWTQRERKKEGMQTVKKVNKRKMEERREQALAWLKERETSMNTLKVKLKVFEKTVPVRAVDRLNQMAVKDRGPSAAASKAQATLLGSAPPDGDSYDSDGSYTGSGSYYTGSASYSGSGSGGEEEED